MHVLTVHMWKALSSAAGNNPWLMKAPRTVQVVEPAGTLAGFPSAVLMAQPSGVTHPRAHIPLRAGETPTALTSLLPRYITNMFSVAPFSPDSGLWRNKERDVYPFRSSRSLGSRTSTPDFPLNLMGMATCEVRCSVSTVPGESGCAEGRLLAPSYYS